MYLTSDSQGAGHSPLWNVSPSTANLGEAGMDLYLLSLVRKGTFIYTLFFFFLALILPCLLLAVWLGIMLEIVPSTRLGTPLQQGWLLRK